MTKNSGLWIIDKNTMIDQYQRKTDQHLDVNVRSITGNLREGLMRVCNGSETEEITDKDAKKPSGLRIIYTNALVYF